MVRYVAFKPPLLRRKHKKPKLHDGPEPWHGGSTMSAGRAKFASARGRGTQHGTGIHGSEISAYPQTQSNAIKQYQKCIVSLCCPFA